MDWIAIVPVVGSLIGTTTGLITLIVKNRKIKKAEEQERTINFYNETAASLVLNAERMEGLTGMQRKEYVMARMENEAHKAGLAVDYVEMSSAIERQVLIMNDHRNFGNLNEVSVQRRKDKLDRELETVDEVKEITDQVTTSAANALIEGLKALNNKEKGHED